MRMFGADSVNFVSTSTLELVGWFNFLYSSVHFANGILDRRTDFLLFHSNMAAFRTAVFSFGLFRCTARVLRSGNCSRRQLLAGLPAVIRNNWISLCTGAGLCAIPFTQKQGEGLSHEALVRRASSLVTDSANTFLSQTTLALVDSLTQYVKAAHMLITLQKRYVASVTKLNPMEEKAVWEVIIRQRAEVTDRRNECKRFESSWKSAVDLSLLAVEAAYSAGADHAAVTARTGLQVAQSHVKEVQQRSLEADRLLVESSAERAERTAHLAAAPAEEEDVPEAYLRED
ncbi:hypothetical protein SKAU_G00321720 [Synaphobranchus kaupii]|uniref:Direct IAP-binding protein with low pI n=1 Tax=Synaphobranchus kaupii TaxID=118154 RepID=A0A9Q1ENV7_SYNKA|nr:hypothetical protein SKAU_G00321720 [Synaphobranchus kaupii]